MTLTYSAARLAIANCTIAWNRAYAVYHYTASANNSIRNSILWDNYPAALKSVYNVQDANVSYSILSSTNGFTGAGVSAQDPLFGYWYYLRSGSPAIDAGDANASALGLDAGYAEPWRTDAGTVDLGYHYPEGFAVSLTNLYVDASMADDSGNGLSWPTACRSLTNALAKAQAGTTINVATGTYSAATTGDAFPLTLDTEAVRIIGTNAAATILDAGGAARVMTVQGVGVLNCLSNLTFRGGNAGAGNGGGLYIEDSRLTVAGCVVSNNTATSGGGLYIRYSKPAVANCVIRNNTISSEGAGAYIYGSVVTFERCQIRKNAGRGFYIREMPCGTSRFVGCLIATNGGDGLYVLNASPVELVHCTIADNTKSGGADAVNDGGGKVKLLNSITVGYLRGIPNANVTYTRTSYTNTYTGEGVIGGDPLFTETAAGDYTLQVKPIPSPCINAGARLPWMSADAVDLNGDRRIQGSAPDMGAYEAPYIPPQGTLFLFR